MWEEIKQRYADLIALDSNCVIGMAKYHKYQFNPAVSVDKVRELEERINIELPDQLKAYYLEMGNGGFGPDCDMHPIESVVNFRADQEWKGCKFYDYNCEEDFEDCVCGFLNIMGAGYAHENGIVTNGDDKGKIIAFSSGGGWIFEQSKSLIDFYHEGLDRVFKSYNVLRDMISEKLVTEEILRQFDKSFRIAPENVLTQLASMLAFPFTYDDALEAFIDKMNFQLKDELNAHFNSQMEQFRGTEKSLQRSKLFVE